MYRYIDSSVHIANLTPSEEEQVMLVLAGKCPHNKGWLYTGFACAIDSYVYECVICDKVACLI